MSFDYLIKQLKNPASINMMNVAKLHLSFILKTPVPKNKLPLWPDFNLSSADQPYTNVIKKLTQLSLYSADHNYYLWNRYFQNITRCGIQVSTHLGLLDRRPTASLGTARDYWRRAHDPLFNIKVDHHGPRTCYRLEPTGINHGKQLSLFFLNHEHGLYLKQKLIELKLSPNMYFYEKNFQRYEQEDKIYSSQASIFCFVPRDTLNAVQKLLKRGSIDAIKPKSSPIRQQCIPVNAKQQQGHLDLIVYWNRSHLLTVSFEYDAFPQALITALQNHLKLSPDQSSTSNHLIYKYRFILVVGSLYDVHVVTHKF